MNHTKGPWVVARDNRSSGYLIKMQYSAVSKPGVICEVKPFDNDLDGNTSLICMAPDMFAILKKLCTSKRVTQSDWYEAESILNRASGNAEPRL